MQAADNERLLMMACVAGRRCLRAEKDGCWLWLGWQGHSGTVPGWLLAGRREKEGAKKECAPFLESGWLSERHA